MIQHLVFICLTIFSSMKAIAELNMEELTPPVVVVPHYEILLSELKKLQLSMKSSEPQENLNPTSLQDGLTKLIHNLNTCLVDIESKSVQSKNNNSGVKAPNPQVFEPCLKLSFGSYVDSITKHVYPELTDNICGESTPPAQP